MERSKYLNVDIEKSWAGYAYVRCPQIALVGKWLEVIFFKVCMWKRTRFSKWS